jgi:hypothetical protein
LNALEQKTVSLWMAQASFPLQHPSGFASHARERQPFARRAKSYKLASTRALAILSIELRFAI